jgi:cytochrome b subunit of formate dehydrogenase
VKRLALALFILLSWLALMAAAGAQTVGGDGWPPQTPLFTDALFLARATPFLIALGIVVGIVEARAAARGGGDAILGERVRRHDTGTLIAHWMNAFGLILGLVTGAMVLRWTDRALELRAVFVIHYVGAGLTLFAIFNHLTRHGVSGGTGLIPKSFRILRDLIGELLEYAGLFGPEGAVLRISWPKALRQPVARYVRALLGYKPSDAGKYLATEKTLSYPPWATLIGLIVVTGLIKELKYVYVIPGSVIATATAIHDLTAIAIGVMLIIHLLPLLLVPANWPLLLSMFKTTVPREYVEKRHPVWYKALQARLSAHKAAGEADAEREAAPVAEVQTGD